jgi:Putative serine esterase (DUF676)
MERSLFASPSLQKWNEFWTLSTATTTTTAPSLPLSLSLNLSLIPPSPFRILLPEEEDDLFFDNKAEHNQHNHHDTFDQYSLDSNATTVTHFMFLVHGHRGHSRDLSYVQAVLRRLRPTTTNGANNGANAAAATARLVVHSCTANEKKTDDGVVAGGERLVQEMLNVIRSTLTHHNNTSTTTSASALRPVTISLWGNSLGGLYARYAIALLADACRASCRYTYHRPTTALELDSASSSSNFSHSPVLVLDDWYALQLAVFCTTATPHLGISGHTFVALPRTAEIGVANMMGETGKDLFRLNTLLWNMAVQANFTTPLAAFGKRICYANAFGTDFPVPAATAAFLSSSSTYPHFFANDALERDPTDTMAAATDENYKSKNDIARRNSDPMGALTDQPFHEVPPRRSIRNASSSSSLSSLVVATLHTPAARANPEASRLQHCIPRRHSSTSIAAAEAHKSRETKNSDDSSSSSTGSESVSQSTNSDQEDGQSESLCDDQSEGGEEEIITNATPSTTTTTLDDELAQMSVSLDALGWKKVFVDMRKEVPRIAIPKSILPRLSSSTLKESAASDSNQSFGSSSCEDAANDSVDPVQGATESLSAPVDSIESLKGKGTVVSSKDVAAAVLPPLSTKKDDELFALHWPIGHNMMVAFSRSRWSTYMNKAGRPVVDALAQELVDDIFGCPILPLPTRRGGGHEDPL